MEYYQAKWIINIPFIIRSIFTSHKTTTAIGRELDVKFLLEGSFQKFGDNVRLIVRLIKTGKEGHIWANNYDRNWSDIFAVQSEVAQAVAGQKNN